jgi:hypothetical protein
MCHPMWNTCHSEDTGTFPEVPIQSKFHLRKDYSALTWLLRFNRQEGQSLTRVQIYFRAQSWRKHNNANALSWRLFQEEYRHSHGVDARADKAGMSYRICSHSWLKSSGSKNRKTEWTKYIAHSEGMETGQIQDLNDSVDSDTTYKSYWDQYKMSPVSKSILERNRKSTNGRNQRAQIFLCRSILNDVLT